MLYFGNPLRQLTKYGPWLQVPGFFTKEECDKVIQFMPNEAMRDGRVDEAGLQNKNIRAAKVCGLGAGPDSQWIFQKLEQTIMAINNEIYQFDVMGFHEAIQLIRYDEGDHYDWHMDFSNAHHSNRKLSVSVQLTDPSEYTGGHLEFFRNGFAPTEIGTLIMFPSFFHHKVHPIVTGTRRAMVGWVSGHPYK